MNREYKYGYRLLPNGQYEYKPKKKVLFGSEMEKLFQSLSDKVKREKK